MIKKFKITYRIVPLKAIYTGAIETENAFTWFAENAPQKYKLVGCNVINGEEFDKLEKLERVFTK